MDTKLETYNKKRNFKSTPEPQGKSTPNKDELRFVVQLHQATQLHYDFRIELNGVLKSWAIPKGPPTETKQKHLAMMTEDHPFDYKDFEGVIPEGNYGAGTVMIWDEGTYHIPTSENKEVSEQVLNEELERGNVKLYLDGKKLKGEFALVRFKRAGENAWLMIKHNDEFANKMIANKNFSVRSGKTLEEIAGTTESK